MNPEKGDQDLWDVLASGLIGAPDKAELSRWLRQRKVQRQTVALWLSVETMDLIRGYTSSTL